MLLLEEPLDVHRVRAGRLEARLLEPFGERDDRGEHGHGAVLRQGVQVVPPCRQPLDLLAVVARGPEPAEQPVEEGEGRSRGPVAVLRHEAEGREDAAHPVGRGFQKGVDAADLRERGEDAPGRAREVVDVVAVDPPE